jgi:hypothetical protein
MLCIIKRILFSDSSGAFNEIVPTPQTCDREVPRRHPTKPSFNSSREKAQDSKPRPFFSVACDGAATIEMVCQLSVRANFTFPVTQLRRVIVGHYFEACPRRDVQTSAADIPKYDPLLHHINASTRIRHRCIWTVLPQLCPTNWN